ncbi:MAG: methylmalonyl Co-A mutase-associated GTPase MeaB, partial [Acidimicrobiia bacterium]
MPAVAPAELVERARAGDRGALAKLITRVEEGGAEARAVVAALHAHTGEAWSIGITGAPGAG